MFEEALQIMNDLVAKSKEHPELGDSSFF